MSPSHHTLTRRFTCPSQDLGGFHGPLPKEVLFKLPELKDILLYHIVPGLYDTTLLIDSATYPTCMKSDIVVDRVNGKV